MQRGGDFTRGVSWAKMSVVRVVTTGFQQLDTRCKDLRDTSRLGTLGVPIGEKVGM